MLYEDGKTNRMHESLKLFKEICNSKWFVDTAMILFLNKKDLFADKIKTVDLKCCFPEYKGGCDYDKAVQFIQEKFLAQNENPRKLLYPNITCATDTKNIQVVFTAVQDIVLRDAIDQTSMLWGVSWFLFENSRVCVTNQSTEKSTTKNQNQKQNKKNNKRTSLLLYCFLKQSFVSKKK